MNSDNVRLAFSLIPLELWHTVYMVFASAFFAALIGLPIGVMLTVVGKGHIKEQKGVYGVIETIVNVGRSIPFAILMIALIPFTRWVVGTSLGTTASIVPLTIAAAPFFARLVENNLNALDRQILESAQVMGSTTMQIVCKVLLPEALPAIVASLTTTIVNLVGYSAMAGLIGGGGLGQVAIQYGYQRFNTFLMVITLILLILLVQVVQWIGSAISKSILKKRGIL